MIKDSRPVYYVTTRNGERLARLHGFVWWLDPHALVTLCYKMSYSASCNHAHSLLLSVLGKSGTFLVCTRPLGLYKATGSTL